MERPPEPGEHGVIPKPPVGTRWVATSPGGPAAPPVTPAEEKTAHGEGSDRRECARADEPPAASRAEVEAGRNSMVAGYTADKRAPAPTAPAPAGFGIGA